MVAVGVFDTLQHMVVEFFDKHCLLFRKNIFDGLAMYQQD